MAGLAHAHDRARARQQPVHQRGVGRLGLGVQHGVGHLAEGLGQLLGCRRALLHVALEGREVQREAADLLGAAQLLGIALATIDGALEVGELEGEQHLRGIGVGAGGAVGLALEECLHVALQRCKRGGQRRQIGSLGGALEPLLDLALQGIEPLGQTAGVGTQARELAVEAGDAGSRQLGGVACRLFQIGNLARQRHHLRRLGSRIGGGRRPQRLLQLGEPGHQLGRKLRRGADLGIECLGLAGELCLRLAQRADRASHLLDPGAQAGAGTRPEPAFQIRDAPHQVAHLLRLRRRPVRSHQLHARSARRWRPVRRRPDARATEPPARALRSMTEPSRRLPPSARPGRAGPAFLGSSVDGLGLRLRLRLGLRGGS